MNTLLTAAILTGVLAGQPKICSDYREAWNTASQQKKLLVVDIGQQFDWDSLDVNLLSKFVVCQLPNDAKIKAKGEKEGETILIKDHPAFAAVDGKGIAIVDLANEKFENKVVSVLPARHVTKEKVKAMLELPAGSLTQRTLIWAFRIHPEKPLSVFGEPSPELLAHAERHSAYQASINVQHHNLPVSIASSEIVAESWPWNKNVVDAAIDIVWSWRQSPGHWGAASAPFLHFGYDMARNGEKWFATGVFR